MHAADSGKSDHLRNRLVRFHRDQRGGAIDWVLILAVLIPVTIFAYVKLFDVIEDFFSMIAFYASWPFL